MSKPKPNETSKKDKIIELMFNVLPATTMEEIATRIRHKIPNVNRRDVQIALGHLRRNTEKYGWTVPHVGGDAKQKNRYFVLLVEKDGSYYFDKNPESVGNMQDGSKSIVNRIATESSNQAVMCRIAAIHTRKRNRRFEWNALAMDIDYVARKAKALAQNIAGDEDGKAAA